MKRNRIIVNLLVLMVLSACSIKLSMGGASIPEDLKTYSVQYFDNRAPLINPLLSQNLTEGMKDRVANESRLVLKTNLGDVDFSGEITGYDVRPMSIQADAVSALTRLTMVVKVRYKNYKNPKENWESSFTAYREYPSEQNINSVEEQLTNEMILEITENVFNKAFSNW